MVNLPKFSRRAADYSKLRLEPLVVYCWLRSPVVVYQFLHLDGILAAAVLEDTDHLGWLPPLENDFYFIPLPLLRRGTSQWYWAASIGLPLSQPKRFISKWIKTYDDGVEDYGYSVLEYRYSMPLPVLSVEGFRFFAFGNQAEVKRLLRLITHVGKKRAYGFGEVDCWEVIRAPEDTSEVFNGILVRPIPVQECLHKVAGKISYYACRPPYWCPANFTPCYMPGCQVMT